MKKVHYVGLDVHARSIAAAVAKEDGVFELGHIEHDVSALRRLLEKLGRAEDVHIVYEAGPTGFGLCRSLREAGYDCDVIAPSLIPSMPGDRVKTDRRDAKKLATLSRGGLLRPVTVPEPEREALRDLVRARECAKATEKMAGQQLDKFLLRHGRRPPTKMTKWTQKHMRWVRSLQFANATQQAAFDEYLVEYDHQQQRVARLDKALLAAAARLPERERSVLKALEALKGIRFTSAVTILSEIGDVTRFARPSQLMSYAGIVPREYSSGERVRHGSITKSGNAHLRRIVGEAAWAYARGRATASPVVRARRTDVSAAVVEIAERADERLHRRFRLLLGRGKHINKVVGATARELLGFIWAIAAQAQRECAGAVA